MPLNHGDYGLSKSCDFSNDYNVKWISERHIACVFLLDISDSMDGTPIDELNKGIAEFKRQTLNNPTLDEHTKSCIDVAVITFDSQVKLIQDFVPIEQMEIPRLSADGICCLGGALNLGLDLITERKRVYNELGTPYYRPWLFCINSGYPFDEYMSGARRLKEMEAEKKVLGYYIGTGDYHREIAELIFNENRIFDITNLDFVSLFQFVSNSLAAIRKSDSSAGNTGDTPVPNNIRLAF